MKIDIVKIINLLQGYGYELDIIPLKENSIRINVRSEKSYSGKTIDLNAEAMYAGNLNDIIYRRVLEAIMNLKSFEGGYKHIYCSCGGAVYDKGGGKDLNFTCMCCKNLSKVGT